MKVTIASSLFLTFIGSCGLSSNLPVDSYREAIDTAVALKSRQNAERSRDALVGAMWNWKSARAYQEIRMRLNELGEGDQLRLEIGNQNRGSYDAIWIVGRADRVTAVYKLGASAPVLSMELKKSSWDALVAMAESLKSNLAGCTSRLGVNDGSAYFGSFSISGRVSSFAVYGLDFFPVEGEEQVRSAEAMAACKVFVEQMFRAVGAEPVPRIASPQK